MGKLLSQSPYTTTFEANLKTNSYRKLLGFHNTLFQFQSLSRDDL